MVRSKLIEVPIKEVFEMFITVVKKGFACCLIAQVALAGIVRAESEVADTTTQADSLTSTVAETPEIISQHLMKGIEVVGDKVGRDIQDLPTSAAVVGQERMENEPISTINDVFNRVANVRGEGPAQLGGTLSIRGINNAALSASYGAASLTSSLNLNQVPLSPVLTQWLVPTTWDVNAVEVLRGPQSTLQGANSLAGAIFFNYNRPDFSWDGGFRAEYGELDTWNLAFYQNIPLKEDVLAGRVTLETRNSDGGITNPLTGADDIAAIDEKTARLQFLYQPLGNDDITFNLTGIYLDSETRTSTWAVEYDGTLANDGFGTPYGDFNIENLSDRYNVDGSPNPSPAEAWLIALESDFRLDENWRIAAVTGYSDLRVDYIFDGDYGPLFLTEGDVDLEEYMFSQDVRLHYESDRFRGLIGGFYSESKSLQIIDAYGNFFGGFESLFDIADRSEVAALYANINFDISDYLTLNAGLRYNTETWKNNSYFRVVNIIEDKEAAPEGEEDFEQFLPSASLTVKLSEDVNAGVKYAKGYRSGGIANAPFALQTESFDEEIAHTYELFFRSVLLDDRLTLNGNVFFIDWRDQQVPYVVPGGDSQFDQLIANAGKTEIKGFEVEVRAEMTDALETFLALGLSQAEFKEFDFFGRDLAGEPLPYAPEWTVAIGANYSHSSGFFAGGTYRWVDETYSNLGQEVVTSMSTRNILDAKVGYRKGNWAVYAWGTNLLDDFYETGGVYDLSPFLDPFMTVPEGVPGRSAWVNTPRRLGIGVEARW